MSTHALAQGGPRLIEGLPCTLQPNAVLMAAPPTERAASLVASGLIYCALASVLVAVAGTKAGLNPMARPHVDFIIREPGEPRVVAARPVARSSGNGLRPPDAPVTLRPAATEQLPELTPSVLPTGDHSGDGQFTADMAVNQEGTGKVVPAGPEPGVGTRSMAPVTVDVKSMRVLSQVQPSYPSLARLARLQGSVVLLVTVDAFGVPAEVQVVSGPHPSLCAEAARVARLWRFEPARVDGQAVPAQFHLTVVFRLAA